MSARTGKVATWLKASVWVALSLAIGGERCLEAKAQQQNGNFGGFRARARRVPPAAVVTKSVGEPGPEAPAESMNADADKSDEPPAPSSGVPVQLNLTDGGSLRVTLRTKTIPSITAYGKLEIPTEDVAAIELAPRLPDDVAQRAKAAIARLTSPKLEERSAGGLELLKLREKALIPLLRASRSKDKELAKLANERIEDLRRMIAPELFETRIQDVIETDDSRIAGDVDLSNLEITSTVFGDHSVKLANVRSISTDSNVTATVVPGNHSNVQQFEQQVGKIFAFHVTGIRGGTVWGTDIYSTDSQLGAAAVHAGVLRLGQTGIVRVRILPFQTAFPGSFRNGVHSMPWDGPHGAFRIIKDRERETGHRVNAS